MSLSKPTELQVLIGSLCYLSLNYLPKHEKHENSVFNTMTMKTLC